LTDLHSSLTLTLFQEQAQAEEKKQNEEGKKGEGEEEKKGGDGEAEDGASVDEVKPNVNLVADLEEYESKVNEVLSCYWRSTTATLVSS